MTKQYLTPQQMETLDRLGFKCPYSAFFDETAYGEIDPIAHFAYPDVEHKHPCYMVADLIEASKDTKLYNNEFARIEIKHGFPEVHHSVVRDMSDEYRNIIFHSHKDLIDNLFDAVVYCLTEL